MAEVTNEERQAVLKAMSGEFLGTGHWYVLISHSMESVLANNRQVHLQERSPVHDW